MANVETTREILAKHPAHRRLRAAADIALVREARAGLRELASHLSLELRNQRFERLVLRLNEADARELNATSHGFSRTKMTPALSCTGRQVNAVVEALPRTK